MVQAVTNIKLFACLHIPRELAAVVGVSHNIRARFRSGQRAACLVRLTLRDLFDLL